MRMIIILEKIKVVKMTIILRLIKEAFIKFS
jgi:hypothetical protein